MPRFTRTGVPLPAYPCPTGTFDILMHLALVLMPRTRDIDMVVQSGYSDDEQGNKSRLFQLRSALTRDGIAAQAFVVTRARHMVMNIEGPAHCPYKADISINSLDGVDAVALINDYAVRMPAMRPLVMVLKGLLALHKLGSAASSGLSSYATISMVISFLQVCLAPVGTSSLGADACSR